MLTITDSPKMATRKYSAEPNFSAILASCGARNSSANTETMPPKNDPVVETPMALPPNPFCVIGKPSNVVAMLASVPGVRSRMAVSEPPYTELQYTAPSSISPSLGSMPKVIGMASATPMVDERPGSAPTTRPATVPTHMISSACGVTQSRIALINRSNISVPP